MAATEPGHGQERGLVARLLVTAGLAEGIACEEVALPVAAVDPAESSQGAPGDACADVLMAEEAALVVGARPEVRAAFAAGRGCAHRALERLGAVAAPLLRSGDGATGADRAPAWPSGFTGSIAHSRALCAAIAARTDTHRALGLDLEAPSRITPRILDRICTPAEREDMPRGAPPARQAIHFAAREAFYKVWSPSAGRPIGFRDVEVSVRGPMRFEVRVRPGIDLAPFDTSKFDGHWAAAGDLIVALVGVRVG